MRNSGFWENGVGFSSITGSNTINFVCFVNNFHTLIYVSKRFPQESEIETFLRNIPQPEWDCWKWPDFTRFFTKLCQPSINVQLIQPIPRNTFSSTRKSHISLLYPVCPMHVNNFGYLVKNKRGIFRAHNTTISKSQYIIKAIKVHKFEPRANNNKLTLSITDLCSINNTTVFCNVSQALCITLHL